MPKLVMFGCAFEVTVPAVEALMALATVLVMPVKNAPLPKI